MKAKKCSNPRGTILRNSCKQKLTLNPPIPGEVVYALDTGEHGWLDENGVLLWVKIGSFVKNAEKIVFKGTTVPTSDIGEDGDLYMQSQGLTKINHFTQNIFFEYSDFVKGKSYINSSALGVPNIGSYIDDELFKIFATKLVETIVDGKENIDFSLTLIKNDYNNPSLLTYTVNDIDFEFPEGAYDKDSGIWTIAYEGLLEDFIGFSDYEQMYRVVKSIKETNDVVPILRSETETFPYTEWTKIEGQWKKQYLNRIVFEVPKDEYFKDDPNGTVYYVLEK